MSNELIIDASGNEVVIALLDDKRLVELNREKTNSQFAVGDIYLGRVRKVMPGLNAAFVDVGYEKDAFLHYFDLGPQVLSLNKFVRMTISQKQKHAALAYFKPEHDIQKDGKITDVLQGDQQVLIQIAKEPISTKGPRITSELSIAGRYIVLIPFSDKVSVSQKIRSHEERERLKRLILSIKPKNFGVIVRTVAEGKGVADLDADMNDLVSKWNICFQELTKAKPPQRVLGELNRTSAILRDLLNASFNAITVNDQRMYEEVKEYLQSIAPDKEKIVKLHKGPLPIFEQFGLDRQIKALFGKTVTMKSGAYLIVEHTEALHVIDVNSGNRSKSHADQESNAFEVNMEAAVEVARQLRLRDMGGIIVVDFIDLHSPNNRRLLYNKLRDEMKNDRAKHTILPPSKFGLVQITRERVRPETSINTSEKCPTCGGTGEVQASILLIDQIENNLRYVLKEQNEPSVTLCVHPYIEAYLTKGMFFKSQLSKWKRKYNKTIGIKAVSSYQFLEYHFLNKNEDEIKV
ncbi:MAG TPA: Rne/Rng family ribonuclease [Bacteroidia bacterium]|nr:Rne/Rng family ribonuclease [Bacteroidia bacterium]